MVALEQLLSDKNHKKAPEHRSEDNPTAGTYDVGDYLGVLHTKGRAGIMQTLMDVQGAFFIIQLDKIKRLFNIYPYSAKVNEKNLPLVKRYILELSRLPEVTDIIDKLVVLGCHVSMNPMALLDVCKLHSNLEKAKRFPLQHNGKTLNQPTYGSVLLGVQSGVVPVDCFFNSVNITTKAFEQYRATLSERVLKELYFPLEKRDYFIRNLFGYDGVEIKGSVDYYMPTMRIIGHNVGVSVPDGYEEQGKAYMRKLYHAIVNCEGLYGLYAYDVKKLLRHFLDTTGVEVDGVEYRCKVTNILSNQSTRFVAFPETAKAVLFKLEF
jgi:hypothetical protein